MADFKQRVLRENGFTDPRPSCLKAEIAPARRYPISSSAVREEQLTQRDVRATLRELPAYSLEPLAPVDPETGLPGIWHCSASASVRSRSRTSRR